MNPWANVYPDAAPVDPVRWAEDSKVQCDGHTYDSSLAPQMVEPMRAMSLANKTVRKGTLVAPVQSGKSTAAEIVTAYWCKFGYGFIQSNLQDDLKAKERWKDRFLPCLRSAGLPWAGGRDELVCEARFEKTFLRVQGVFNENALNSDTIPLQVNDEVHLWKPGYLAMARDRQTRIWNSKAFDISNAARAGTQLHLAFQEGTMREWLTACPVCGVLHAMHFRFDKNKPELGGLRYDSSTRLPDGRPNYRKLEETIRYQFPCGHEVKADPASRRTLRGEYSPPRNEGAHESHESWISEAVSYDQISWLTLIQEWHSAIQALKSGDSEPMFRFVTRRECKFYTDEFIPYRSETIYNVLLKKNRVGMGEKKLYRAAKFDWQKGYKAKGELEHYWGVILDVDVDANSQLVWEGMVESDSELLAELEAHEVPHCNVWIDCTGTHKKSILQLCYQNGLNALDLGLSRQTLFLHPDGVRRFYSTGKPIHRELNTPPVFNPVVQRDRKTGERKEIPNPEEPVVVSLNKAGMLANYFFIRNMKVAVLLANPKATPADYIALDIPNDVSEDFKQQNESWQVIPGHRGSAKDDSVDGFKPRSNNDHLLMCMAYHCFELEWKLHPNYELSLLGARLAALGIPQAENKTTTEEEK